LLITLELAELSGSTVYHEPDVHFGGGPELTMTFGGDRAEDDHTVTFSEDLVGSDPQGPSRSFLASSEELQHSLVTLVIARKRAAAWDMPGDVVRQEAQNPGYVTAGEGLIGLTDKHSVRGIRVSHRRPFG
jgi:hypothetical protein